eukprot:366121-Chlamydomonas_euryale.AAC.6
MPAAAACYRACLRRQLRGLEGSTAITQAAPCCCGGGAMLLRRRRHAEAAAAPCCSCGGAMLQLRRHTVAATYSGALEPVRAACVATGSVCQGGGH